MNEMTCISAMEMWINRQPQGAIFGLQDFDSFGSYDAVRKAMTRIEKHNYIRRLLPGFYQFVGEADPAEYEYPTPLQVATAMARCNQWTLVPGQEQARYMLGLSEKEPERFIYFTSGDTRSYSYGEGNSIRFRLVGCAGKLMSMTPDCAVVVSAFYDLDKHPITAAEVFHLSNTLSEEDKNNLMRQLPLSPVKLRPVFKIICNQYDNKK